MIEAIEPFRASPYPSALYLTTSLKETLRTFRNGIRSRQGLMVLVGDKGIGKSSLLQLMYGDLSADPAVETIIISTPNQSTPLGLIKAVSDQLAVPPQRSLYAQQQALEAAVSQKSVSAEHNVVVLIDEAQLISRPCLEALRWMLNIETEHAKLIQFILAGQIELWTRLCSKWNQALKSRVYALRTMQTLSLDEIRKMLEYRCDYAGVDFPFEQTAVGQIYELTSGVPRSVLHVANEAWLRRDDCPSRLMTAEFVTDVAKILRQEPVKSTSKPSKATKDDDAPVIASYA